MSGVISLEKYSEVIGLPVICAENGKMAGIIKDIIFCPKTKEVKAFLLEKRGHELGKKAVLLKDVLSVGRDAVVVNDYTCLNSLKKLIRNNELKDKGEIKGLKVYTKSGEDLGIVKDVLFDYKKGLIEGVEISDGLFQDIVQGRNLLPLFGKVEFGEESVIVDKEAAEEMVETGGGLKNILK